MKYIIVLNLLILTAFTNPLQAQDAIETYFGQYAENEDFTAVYVSAKMFSLISKVEIDLNDPEAEIFLEMVEDLKGLRVLVTQTNPMTYYKEAAKSINTTDYEVLMTVRDDGQNVKFWIKEDPNGDIGELLLLVSGVEEFVMLSIVGKIDLAKISQLAKQLDIDGVEHLNKIETQ